MRYREEDLRAAPSQEVLDPTLLPRACLSIQRGSADGGSAGSVLPLATPLHLTKLVPKLRLWPKCGCHLILKRRVKPELRCC